MGWGEGGRTGLHLAVLQPQTLGPSKGEGLKRRLRVILPAKTAGLVQGEGVGAPSILPTGPWRHISTLSIWAPNHQYWEPTTLPPIVHMGKTDLAGSASLKVRVG